MASSINLNGLNAYVEQKSDELLTKAIMGAKTLDVIDIMLDVIPSVRFKLSPSSFSQIGRVIKESGIVLLSLSNKYP